MPLNTGDNKKQKNSALINDIQTNRTLIICRFYEMKRRLHDISFHCGDCDHRVSASLYLQHNTARHRCCVGRREIISELKTSAEPFNTNLMSETANTET